MPKAQGVESYPTIKFFSAGSKEGVAYVDGRSENDFVSYINEKAGTHRVAGGELNALAGTIASLNAYAAKLLDGGKLVEVAAEVKAEAEKIKEGAQQKYAEYYVRVVDKLGKNEGYAAKELRRLEGILSKGGLAPSKRDEIQRKTNVLHKFVTKVAEKVEEVKEEL